MTREQARAEAERRFGDTRSVGEACQRDGDERDRRARRNEYRDELRQDVSFAWRQLARAPGFSAVAIVTLALGSDATAAVSARSTRSSYGRCRTRSGSSPSRPSYVAPAPILRSFPEFLALRSSRVFESVAGLIPGVGISMKLGEVPEIIAGTRGVGELPVRSVHRGHRGDLACRTRGPQPGPGWQHTGRICTGKMVIERYAVHPQA